MRKHANRTYLLAPGNQKKRLEKTLNLSSNIVILVLEDACPIKKEPAVSYTHLTLPTKA